MSSENDNEEVKEEGKVWASYSDMFTTMAIIFLVMFVFALIKSGITTLQTVAAKKKHESELMGKLTVKEEKRNKKKIEEVNKSIDEMNEYKEIIDTKIQSLNHFVKKMQDNKKVLASIMKDQLKKDAMISNLREKLEENQGKIKDLNKSIVQEITQKDNLQDTIYKKEGQITKLSKSIKTLKTKLTTKLDNQKQTLDTIKKLEKEVTQLHAEKTQLGKEIVKENETIKKYQNQLAKYENENKKYDDQTKKLSSINDKLESDMKSIKKSMQKYQEQISNLESKVAQGQKSHSNLKQQLSNAKGQSDQLLGEIGKLNSANSSKEKTIGSLKGKINDLQGKLLGERDKLQDSKNKITQLIIKEKKIRDRLHKITKTIVSARKNLRTHIANNLANKFKNLNIDVEVNPVTGNVTLRTDQNFQFKRNSFELGEMAKTGLKKIIPIYSSVLFDNKKIKKKISSFNIVGHASPTYKNECLDHLEAEMKAYNYNLNLSARRATEITKYIFGEEIGKFSHKIYMRSISNSIGKGFSEPVMASTNVSQQEKISKSNQYHCYKYDISKSQRVELSFTLKDDIESIEVINQLADI